MKKEEVPQDRGMTGELREVTYAVNNEGRYELVSSHGWEAKNITLVQAWDVIAEDLSVVLQKVKSGELSPLAYHMTKNLMDVKLLSKYVRMSCFRIKRHLKPEIFRKLKPAITQRYAVVFGITPEQLYDIPAEVKFDFKKDEI